MDMDAHRKTNEQIVAWLDEPDRKVKFRVYDQYGQPMLAFVNQHGQLCNVKSFLDVAIEYNKTNAINLFLDQFKVPTDDMDTHQRLTYYRLFIED